MKRIISLLLALCLLAACTLAGAENTHLQGKPWVNSNLYGQWPDERPAPEDGYDMYANYDYYREVPPIEEITGSYARIIQGEETVQEQFLSLCKDPEWTGTEVEILQILYRLYTDAEKREQDGLAPLQPYADRLRAVSTQDELTSLIREDGWMYGPALYNSELVPAGLEGGIYTLYIGMVEFIDYLPLDPVTFESPGKDIEGAKETLRLLGYSAEEAAGAVEKILAFADQLEASNVIEEDLEVTVEERGTASLNDLRELCPLVPELLTAQGLVREGTEAEQIYKISAAHLHWFRDLYLEENLEVLKAVLMLGMYAGVKPVLPKTGEDGETETSFDSFNFFIPETIKDQAYLHSYVPQERLDMYYRMADEYKEAMRVRLEQSSWLSEGTKQEALRKLDKLVASKLDYAYGDIDCTPLLEKLRSCGNLLEAAGLCGQFDRECMAHFSGRDTVRGNRFRSGHTLLICEGQYVPHENIFYLGGGSLVIAVDMTSREMILGSIGVHMAHELSHGFDTTGSQFNADFTGSLFTEEDQRIFNEKAETIARQITAIEPLDGMDGNGPRKIGEVVADLTGMSLTLDIARKDTDFDYDAFFRAFAWFFFCYMIDPVVNMPRDIAMNPHPLPYIRINFTVQHFDEFYQTYPSVTEGTPMYLAPEDRLLIW